MRKLAIDGITTIEEAKAKDDGLTAPAPNPETWPREAQQLAERICGESGIKVKALQAVGRCQAGLGTHHEPVRWAEGMKVVSHKIGSIL